MPKDKFESQKKVGKTKYSGRRRPATRRSGFQTHAEATGGRYSYDSVGAYQITNSEPLRIRFELPPVDDEKFVGLGFYFRASQPIKFHCNNSNFERFELSEYAYPSWNKCGHIWKSEAPENLVIEISAFSNAKVEIFNIGCGVVWHEYFKDARENIMKNIHKFAPEALFFTKKGDVQISSNNIGQGEEIPIKECNRCARFLPVNLDNERNTLSFSNHCVRHRPCTHKGFGRLENLRTKQIKQLEYGFQLECRFCKKFVVNAALNPQRNADQMKEDAQRRRYFELLLAELYNQSKQLDFRHKTEKELATYIWNKFQKKCFKCKKNLPSARNMHLDHTRPLAFLWALDETATALCKDCNTSKRDRFPSEFYANSELVELSKLTGISLSELKNPSPNLEALSLIISRRDWLYSEFLNKEDLLEEKDGKIPAELICKALDRVLSFFEGSPSIQSFVDGWNAYNRS